MKDSNFDSNKRMLRTKCDLARNLSSPREDVSRSQTAIMAAVGYAATANTEVGELIKQFKHLETRMSRLEELRK